ncbi:hypothetical protein OAO18_03740 [Francisellaceae bacterium]|nr:hypothetical protein [Francisellaceae bacterium]
MKRKIIITSLLTAIVSSPIFAGYYNPDNSGFIASISGGVVSSQSSAGWVTWPSGTEYSYTAPATTGGTGSIRLGYQVAFGEKENWNEFYFGGALRYNILGNVVTDIVGVRNLTVGYIQTSISQFGVEGYIGKYWKSPFYTELFINPGFTNTGSAFGAIGLRAGYDVTEHVSIYVEGMTGGQVDAASSIIQLIFWQVGASGTSYTTGQAGIQYRF